MIRNFLSFVLVTEISFISFGILCAEADQWRRMALYPPPYHDQSLERFVIDPDSSTVYLSATNNLHQLNLRLKLQQTAVTGPRTDSPFCPPPTSECYCSGSNCDKYIKVPTATVSKSLLIDGRNRRLIYCTNLYQGHCERRLLSNISVSEPPVWSLVVSNDNHSSVVMYIAPGPPNPASTNVLYVSATRGSAGLPAYRDFIPAISMRNLQNFQLASDDILHPSRVEVEVQHRDLFRIHYVYGMSSLGFSYFLAVQPTSVLTSDTQTYHTRLARVCQGDLTMNSYTELSLSCRYHGQDYSLLTASTVIHPGSRLAQRLGLASDLGTDDDHILVGVFSNRTDLNNHGAYDSSALCIFLMKDVRKKFTAAIQQCFKGNGSTGPEHLVQPRSCFKTPFHIDDDYCGEHDVNHPVQGRQGVKVEAALGLGRVNITAIGSQGGIEHTVIHLATDTGYIRNIVIESISSAREFGSTKLSDEKILQLEGSASSYELYVLTNKQIYLLEYNDCDEYTTCSACLVASNPFCGWCSSLHRCTRGRDCKKETEGFNDWLTYDEGRCAEISRITPDSAPWRQEATSMIVMWVSHIPHTSSTYQCVFRVVSQLDVSGLTSDVSPDLFTPIIQVEKLNNSTTSLKCETPLPNKIPKMSPGQDHIRFVLSISSDNVQFASTNFTLYDCSTYKSCTSCSRSRYNCWWCVRQHRCTSESQVCSSEAVRADDDIDDLEFLTESCPVIYGVNSAPEIPVYADAKAAVKVKVVGLKNFQTSFSCSFETQPRASVSGYLIMENNSDYFIECDPLYFQLNDSVQSSVVPVTITWGSNELQELDNPLKIHVLVYRCSMMASNCGRCRSMDDRYSCGWCPSSNLCTPRAQCDPENQWLDKHQPCPDPVVHQIFPLTGPMEGGTDLTITGENFGLGLADTSVKICGVPCSIKEYQPSYRLVCRTVRQDSSICSVLVFVGETFTATSSQPFTYTVSSIERIEPAMISSIGGSRVTITGSNLSSGSRSSVIFSNTTLSTLCHVESRSDNQLICVTDESLFPYNASRVVLHIDNSRIHVNQTFHITPPPHIVSIMPNSVIHSGGIILNLEGSWFDSLQNVSVLYRYNQKEYQEACRIISRASLTCLTVALRRFEPPAPDNGGSVARVEFIFNGHLYNSSYHYLKVLPDPTLEQLSDKTIRGISQSDSLNLSGRNLKNVANSEYAVSVGGLSCPVTSVTDTMLSCRFSHHNKHKHSSSSCDIIVKVGRNLSYCLGSLHYETVSLAGDSFAFFLGLPFIASMSTTVCALLCCAVTSCVVYKRRASSREREMKRLQNQMDQLEARVALECKEAFTELQTDVTNAVSNPGGPGGIPYHTFSVFCVNTMFPGVTESCHPVLQRNPVKDSRDSASGAGLQLFLQLLSNKTFLILFIRTLEQKEDFFIRDKINVASLLTICLFGNLEYLTSILRTLMSEMFEKTLNDRIDARLLLRRTESITEKLLTNWLTIFLYESITNDVGEPLYTLFRAVKHQIDRGPVDCITHESKYSLCEDKLIRQQIDYTVLSIQVFDNDDSARKFPHLVKVLDCDSISQVKEKIIDTVYKYVPHSLRPDVQELDLEYELADKSRVILQEELDKSFIQTSPRQLRTLQHYNISDNTRVWMVPRNHKTYKNGKQRFQSYKYDTLFASSLPISRTLSPHSYTLNESSRTRTYHLIKSCEESKSKFEDANQPMVSEIYLTRLLATKGALQQFVDGLFSKIFSTSHNRYTCMNDPFTAAVKYISELLEDLAASHSITDNNTINIWKSNSIPLRVWPNLIKNPELVFDISKPNAVSCCLSTISQTFIDCCSFTDLTLSKDSPSAKLLYARDIPKYKMWLTRYYKNIEDLNSVNDTEMNSILNNTSKAHRHEFNIEAALQELYQYAVKYHDDLMEALEEDEFAYSYRLSARLNQVHDSMDSGIVV